MTQRAADGLDEFLGHVGDRVAAAEVAGFDETGLRVAGRLHWVHWVHCARTGTYTLITCHPRRGTAGIDDAGVLGRFHVRRRARRLGAPMTATSMSSTSCAARTPSASCKLSPTPRRTLRGAGPPRPPTRSWPCNG